MMHLIAEGTQHVITTHHIGPLMAGAFITQILYFLALLGK